MNSWMSMASPHSKRLLLLMPENPQPESEMIVHAQGMQALGWEVDALAPAVPGSLREEVLRGVTILRYRRAKFLRGVMSVLFPYGEGLMWGIRRRQKVVHSLGLFPMGLAGAWIAWFFTIPHVVEVGPGDTSPTGGMAFVLRRYVLKRADAVIAGTTELAVALQKLQPGVRVKVVDAGAAEKNRAETLVAIYAKLLEPEGASFYSYEKNP